MWPKNWGLDNPLKTTKSYQNKNKWKYPKELIRRGGLAADVCEALYGLTLPDLSISQGIGGAVAEAALLSQVRIDLGKVSSS